MPSHKKRMKPPRWPDYELSPIPEGIVTFGTNLFIRKDKQALRILFPAGQFVTFAPKDDPKDQDL